MIGKDIFTFCDIHSSKFSDIGLKLVNRLRSIFFFHDILNLLTLLAKNTFKGIKVLVSHFLKDGIFICESQLFGWFHWASFWIFGCIRLDNVGINSNRTSFDSKYFIKQSFIGLVHAEWRNKINISINQKEAIDF